MTSPNDLLAQIAALLPEIPGWCSLEKATSLVETIREIRPRVCLEIGVFGGSSLLPQALALQQLATEDQEDLTFARMGYRAPVLYGIDPWSTDAALEAMQDDANRAWWSTVSLEEIHAGCQALVDRFDLRPYCRLLRARAEDVAQFFEDGEIDLLHIDGNHSEEKSVRDVALYLPKVRPGGVVFFDDASWAEQGIVTTRRAQDMLAEACDPAGMVGDCAIYRLRR